MRAAGLSERLAIGVRRALPTSLYVLTALAIVLALAVPRFATQGNLINLLRVAGILAIAAYGQAIVIITAGLDFSIGSAVALTSVVTVLLVEPLGTPAAFACGAAAALLTGAVNGVLIGGTRLPPFLVTLGMLIFVHGLATCWSAACPWRRRPAWEWHGSARARCWVCPRRSFSRSSALLPSHAFSAGRHSAVIGILSARARARHS
jgi:ribose/xylose/arabinose/galactoside ABC-type transport system permease subunit